MIETIRSFLFSPLVLNGLTFSFTPLEAILRLVLPIAALFVGKYLILVLVVRRLILRRLRIPEEARLQAYRRTRLALRIILYTALVFVVLGFFGAEIGVYVSKIWEVLTTPR